MSSAACSFATVCASSSTSSPRSGSKRSLHALCEDRRMQTLESLFGLAGRTALVTGGSRGIGRAACLGLAQAGAAVAVHYGSDAAAAAAVGGEIEAGGGRAGPARARPPKARAAPPRPRGDAALARAE